MNNIEANKIIVKLQADLAKSGIVKDSIVSSKAEVKHCLLESSLIGNSSSYIGHYHKLNLGDSSEIMY